MNGFRAPIPVVFRISRISHCLPWLLLAQGAITPAMAATVIVDTTIAAAITAANPDDTVEIPAGDYTENLVITKPLTLQGAGSDTVISGGITVSADDVTLIDLELQGAGGPSFTGYGISIGTPVSGLSIDGLTVTGFSVGFHVSNNGGVTDLDIDSSHFDGNKFGMYLTWDRTTAPTDPITDVEVTNTSFSDNYVKGIYAERLDHATFDTITVTDSGVFEEPWPPGNGVDINLKRADYADIAIINSTFTGGGWYVDEPEKGDLSGALTIKARNDGSYANIPATLTGVTIRNNQFTSNNVRSKVALRLGELTSTNTSAGNTGPTGVTIEDNTFTGYERAFINGTLEPVSATMMAGNTFSGESVVLVRAGNVPLVHSDIQAVVDLAEDADQLLVGAGDYSSFSVPLDGPVDLTIEAADGANITRAASPPLARIVDLRADGTALSGFNLDGGGNHVGVSISGRGVTVEDNTITNVLTGIQTTTQYEDGDNIISGNVITGSRYGISLQNNGNEVTGNTISVSTEGFGIGSGGNTLSSNTITTTGDSGVVLQAYSNTDYPALPGAEIDLSTVLGNNSFGRVAYVTDGSALTVDTLFGSLQAALDAADEDMTVVARAGTYTGNLTISHAGLTLSSDDDAAIVGRISVNAADVTISGLDISNPAAGYGIVINGVSGATVTGNTVHDIGTTTSAGSGAQAIYIDDAGKSADFGDITISNNTISNVGHSQGGTAKGIFIGDSVTSAALNEVAISGNTISNVIARSDVVYASGGRGAYGIQVNYGYNGSSTGSASGLAILDNAISQLTGYWVHGIGLEADTPDVRVEDNVISNLRGTKLVNDDDSEIVSNDRTQKRFRDEVALWFEANPSAEDASVTGNRFSDLTWGLALADNTSAPVAEQNYWGSSNGPGNSGVLVSSGIDYNPWFVNSSLSQLSNFNPPEDDTPTTPTVPADDDVQGNNEIVIDDIQDIIIPDDDQAVTQDTVTAIDNVLKSVDTLARNTSQQISTGQVSTTSAVTVLDTLGKALDLAGNASQKGGTVDQNSARASINGISNILDAISTGTGTAPTEQQKEQIRTVTQQAVGSASKLISTTTSTAQVTDVIGDVANLLDKSVTVGGSLDSNLTDTARTLSENALAKTLASVSASLGVTTTVDTTDAAATRALLQGNARLLNKVVETVAVPLPSTVKLDTAALSATLGNQGLGQAAATKLATSLSGFVNPEGVNLQQSNGTGLSARQAMENSTGNAFNVAVDANTNSLTVANAGLSIPVNVKQVSLVPESIPEGLTILPDGSVLSVSGGMGVTVVPASNDPVGLVTALNGAVDDVTLKPNGGVTMRSGTSTFSGTFGFAGGNSDGNTGVDVVTLNEPPEGIDPADPEFSYSVDYPDGTRQTIAPFVADDSFFDSLTERGLDFSTSRGTGVVTVNGAAFRPAYFVDPPEADDLAFLASNADSSGIAYRATDVNGDGVADFELISASGVQVIYGVRN